MGNLWPFSKQKQKKKGPSGLAQPVAVTSVEETVELKLCLTGNTQVGKTRFIKSYANKKFIGRSTLEPDFIKVKLESVTSRAVKRKFSILLYDTAGQDSYEIMTRWFYQGWEGFFIVFDVTVQETFDKVANFWVKNIADQVNIKEVNIWLVANKIDKVDERVVSTEVGRKYADSQGFLYMETSALEGINVQETFDVLVNKIIKRVNEMS